MTTKNTGDHGKDFLETALKLDRASRTEETIVLYKKALCAGLEEVDERIARICLGSSLRVVGRTKESLGVLKNLAKSNNAAFLFNALSLYEDEQYRALSRLLIRKLLDTLVEGGDEDIRPFERPLRRYVGKLSSP